MGLISTLLRQLNKSRKRILVCGDVMVDHWVRGNVESCQDGCPKFVQKSYCTRPGGAGNAARCLKNWSVDTELFGQLGQDRPEKWRFVDADGKIAFRWDDEAHLSVVDRLHYKWSYDQSLELVKSALVAGVLLSDYDKGFLSPELIHQVADLCWSEGIPCVADVKRAPTTYAKCILKSNEDWYLRHGIASVVTRGADSPLVSGLPLDQYYPCVKCVNHVGAGDCFSAHLVLGLTYGLSLKDSAAIAHSAGRVYVQHPYNRPPRPAEIMADMSNAFTAS